MRTKQTIIRGYGVLSRLLLIGPLLLVVFPFASSCAAQTVDSVETIRVDADLVDLQVSVLSRDPAKLPAALQQRDFLAFEDGVPQEITFFAAADTPFDLVLLLDLSGSTADKLKLIHRSSKRFVGAARPTDRIAIVTFSDVAQVISPLTYNRADLKEAAIDLQSGGFEGGNRGNSEAGRRHQILGCAAIRA